MQLTQQVAIVALLLFTLLMVTIGILSARKTTTMDGFILGGRNMGPWITAFAYGTTYFSAVVFIGYAGMHGWRIGIGGVWIGIGNAIIGSLLAWLILAKRTRRMTHTLDVKTTPEFFERRYLSTPMKIYSALIIFIFLVPYAASVYKGLGVLFSSIFVGVSPVVCMAIVAFLTAIYLILGGYVATAWNDFIQGIIMIIGVIVMVIAIVNHPQVGGIVEGFRKLREIDPQLTNIFGGNQVKFLLTNIALTSFGVWGLPQMIHKYYAIKDEKSIKKATIISTVFALILGGGAYFVGTFGRLFVPAVGTGISAVPDLADKFDGVMPAMLTTALSGNLFSNIILSVILLLLLSASMSTLAAIVLTSASAISIDLIKVVRPNIRDKSQILLTRILCFIFVLLSFLFATANISFIVNLMSFSWGIVAGSFIGPFLWGLYSKKVSKIGAWAGLLSGLVVVGGCISFFTITQGFNVAKSLAPEIGVSAMIVSVIAVPLVSLFTKKYDDKHNKEVFAVID